MKKNWFILTLFGIITVLFFNEIIFFDLTYFQRDIIGQFKPWKIFSKKVFQNIFIPGTTYLDFIPLWNHYNYCGSPLMANLQSQIFYPFSIIFYLLPDFVLAFKIFIIIHFFMSGIFMFILLNSKKLDFLSSIVGSLVWAFNGFMISRIEFLSVMATIIWLPLIIYFIEKLSKCENNRYYTIILEIILALQFLAGHAQMWYYSIIYSLVYVIFLSIINKNSRILLYFVTSILISIFLSAIQFFPTVEFFLNSVRSGTTTTNFGLSFNDASVNSLNIKDLINILYPSNWQIKKLNTNNMLQISNYWLYTFYLGISGTFLSIIGFFIYKNFYKKIFFIIISIITILFSLGQNSFFYKFVYSYLPFTRIFRYPSTSMYIIIFIFSFLSAFGFNYIFKNLKEKKLIYLIILVLFAELYLYKNKISLLLPKSITNTNILSNLNTLSNIEDIKEYRFALTPATQFLDIPSKGKNLFEAKRNFFNRLYGNINLEKEIFNFRGQDVELKNFYKFMDFVYKKPSLEKAIPYLGLANVKYILSIKEQNTKYTTLINNLENEIKIYENKFVLPKIFISNNLIFEPNIEKSLIIMENLNTNIFNTTILHTNENIILKNTNYTNIPNRIYNISFETNKIYFTTNLSSPSIITISQNYYPGWKCYINKKPIKLIHSNIFMTSILVPQGINNIELIFDPTSFKMGCILTLLTILFLLIFWFEKIFTNQQGETYERMC